mmetsp:Transcript_7800/g.21752  ORF Transcript_7800/g.21752 Transcript_7800/m.21752 type:complete len:156 (+) Transcript_7800:225-692(+)
MIMVILCLCDVVTDEADYDHTWIELLLIFLGAPFGRPSCAVVPASLKFNTELVCWSWLSCFSILSLMIVVVIAMLAFNSCFTKFPLGFSREAWLMLGELRRESPAHHARCMSAFDRSSEWSLGLCLAWAASTLPRTLPWILSSWQWLRAVISQAV